MDDYDNPENQSAILRSLHHHRGWRGEGLTPIAGKRRLRNWLILSLALNLALILALLARGGNP